MIMSSAIINNEKEKELALKQIYKAKDDYVIQRHIGYLDPVAESRLLSQLARKTYGGGTMEVNNVPTRL